MDFKEQYESLKKQLDEVIEKFRKAEDEINRAESLLLKNINHMTPEQKAYLSKLLSQRVDLQECFEEQVEDINKV